MSFADAPVIHWFRQDLRLADNPALHAAAATGPVVPVFVHDDSGRWAPGGASRWWLDGSLRRLDEALRLMGSRLVIRRGDPVTELAAVAAATGARAIHWGRCYEPGEPELEQRLRSALGAQLELRRFAGRLLHEPETLCTGAGKPFQVFTLFWRACLAAAEPPAPLPAPARLVAPGVWPPGLTVDDLGLLPRRPDWAGGLREAWQPGEVAAQAALARYLEGPAGRYRSQRDLPGVTGTSRLSPRLHFGEIGVRTVWHATRTAIAAGLPAAEGEAFLRELGWREFSAHLLFHFPTLPDLPLRSEFAAFPWQSDTALLRAWQRGETGYPIVDAGLRELWTTGWMHNRVRMIVASFLVKDLLLPWQEGEAWFWDTLVDADLANNAASWQWVAGCGADAAPYFRVFNPVLQGRKFDADGAYVRRWVPELAHLPADGIHAPWELPAATLAGAGVVLGRDYPAPVVDHRAARARALDAYAALRAGRPAAAGAAG
jgi:deoxyribodipyrimidine photo-lyase